MIRANGGEATAIVWDLACRDAMPRVLGEVHGTFGPIDILVNNTGGPPPAPSTSAVFPAIPRSMILALPIIERTLDGRGRLVQLLECSRSRIR
ncbi:SDR family NAD(P)-dependent oxidoreductase [Mesorhizobium sp.]|uniref:SDR family NAD(P)-dependent oxidoreductase n=1 Tax=Mesorhizobium sp. TaxID=1871066 RepID=UPI0025D42AD3|nr:SDR family NAD(P)-dependent oxidoreductase [Mesorhizobium sp.]